WEKRRIAMERLRAAIGRPQTACLGEQGLTLKLSVAKHSSVKPDKCSAWESLRRRLVAATRESGSKTKLADAFGVSRSAVAQWLSGTTVPAAEAALCLLEWVQAEEAKQQSPDDRQISSEQVTRKRNRNETTPKPGRRKA